MLVLTRKYQEKVRIGDGITITVLRAKGKAVRLGIEAPADVPVIRGELAFHQSTLEKVEHGVESAPGTRRGNAPDRQAHTAPAWTTDSTSRPARRVKHSQAAPQVALRRLPREKAAEMLPQLLSGHGPLREMLDLRTGTL